MSRSVQTMTFMPFVSVVECTCSAPGTVICAGGLVAAAAAAAAKDRIRAARIENGMRHLTGCATLTFQGAEKKSAENGGSRSRRQEANTGEELFAVPFEGVAYLETLVAEIAASWARASRASMGAKLTLPPRRRLTSIPA